MYSLSIQERTVAEAFVNLLELPQSLCADGTELNAKIKEVSKQKLLTLKDLSQQYQELGDKLSKVCWIQTLGVLAVFAMTIAITLSMQAAGCGLPLTITTTIIAVAIPLLTGAYFLEKYFDTLFASQQALQNGLEQHNFMIHLFPDANGMPTLKLDAKYWSAVHSAPISVMLEEEHKWVKERMALLQTMQNPEFFSYLSRENRIPAMLETISKMRVGVRKTSLWLKLVKHGQQFEIANEKAKLVTQEVIQVMTLGNMPKAVLDGLAPLITQYVFEDQVAAP